MYRAWLLSGSPSHLVDVWAVPTKQVSVTANIYKVQSILLTFLFYACINPVSIGTIIISVVWMGKLRRDLEKLVILPKLTQLNKREKLNPSSLTL